MTEVLKDKLTAQKEFKPKRMAGKPFVKNDPRINRNGRPKGSRNKMSENFIADFMSDWENNGEVAIEKMRKSDPSSYVRIALAIMPKEIKQEVEVTDGSKDHVEAVDWDVITGGKSK